MLEQMCRGVIAGQRQNRYIVTVGRLPYRSTTSAISPHGMPNVRTPCEEGRLREALDRLHLMDPRTLCAEPYIYTSLLQSCVDTKSLAVGLRVHSHMIKIGFEQGMFLMTKFVILYSKCGCLKYARQLFDEMSEPNLVSFNAMIAGYAQHDQGVSALTLFHYMQRAGVQIDQYTFTSILKACSGLMALEQGKQIHACTVKSEFESQVVLETALVDMYVKCGSTDDASLVFDQMAERDAVSWNAIIAGCVQRGHIKKALAYFLQMQQAGAKVSQFTFASVISGCAGLGSLEQGQQLHAHVIRRGFQSHVVLLTALVDMYAKCGFIKEACQMFEQMPQRDVVLFNAMIAGYAQQGYGEEALTLFSQMQREKVKPNQFTFASVLSACSCLAALQQGKQVHAHIIKYGFLSDVVLANVGIDMYAKSGRLEDARQVFDKMLERNVVSWTAMITGYGNHGNVKEVIQLFEQMQQIGIKPNHITFLAVLSACSHVGLVDEGWHYFTSMSRDHFIMPRAEHYACFVDLLGRAGRMDEAWEFVNRMAFEPDASIWGSLLGACRNNLDMELGKCIAERLFELNPENPGNYVLLSNIYAAAGRWEEVGKVRTMMKVKGVKKEPGCSWIEVKKKVHTFFVGDRSHPQREEIYAMLDKLAGQIKESGYVPDMNSVLHDVEDEQKEHILGQHSEKLAIAFGLISTLPGTPIQIIKNLRVCSDCHTATKFISKIVEREIIVRDATRFHYFKNGQCSCADYW